MAKLLFLLLLLPFTSGLPQDSIKTDPDFKRALMLYKAAKYEPAMKIFSRLAENSGPSGKKIAAMLFKGKVLTETKKYTEAEAVLTSFLEQFPESRYYDEARLTLAKVFFEQYDYTKALKEIFRIITTTESSFYSEQGKNFAEKIALNYIDPDFIKAFYDSLSSGAGAEKTAPFLLLLLGKINYLEYNFAASEKYLSELVDKFPRSSESGEAEKIYREINQLKEQSSDENLIGVMLPLSGIGIESSEAAKEILEGIKFAVSEYNNVHENKMGLLIRDTQMKPERLRSIKDEFKKTSGLKSIVGPIFSSEVRTALEIFNGIEIPIISPTATDSDLTSINEFFFQANPPFSMRGKIIAQYIYFVENKRKIAVLSSNEGYSVPLSSSFIEEFTKMGGEITSFETYKTNSYDFSAQISKIAEDSLILEGIYVPITNKLDAVPIITEIVKNRLNVPVYGDQDWLLAKGYKTSSGFSNQLIFSSDYFIDYNSQEYQELNRTFYKITKTDANRNVLYGYDTAKYLLTILRNTIGSGILIKHKMESGITSSGLHNNISFNTSRINRFLNIIRYRDDKFELIDKFQAGI